MEVWAWFKVDVIKCTDIVLTENNKVELRTCFLANSCESQGRIQEMTSKQ